MKIDPLWVAIIRLGLMPLATRIFERVLRVPTKAANREPAMAPSAAMIVPCGDPGIVRDT
jgi:hypothetical protein